MDLREVGWSGMNWMILAVDRNRWRAVVNAVMNLQDLFSFSGRTLLQRVSYGQ